MEELNKVIVMYIAGQWTRELKRMEMMTRDIVEMMRGAVPSKHVWDAVKRYESLEQDTKKILESMKLLDKEKQKLLNKLEGLLR